MEQRKRIPSKERREQILNKASDLFGQYGYDGVTTRQLAEAVGCNETILFRIFPSKDAIYQALFSEWEEAEGIPLELELVEDSASQTLARFYEQLVTVGDLKKKAWRCASLGDAVKSRIGDPVYAKRYEQAIQAGNDIVRNTIVPVIQYGQEKGEFRKTAPEILAGIYWQFVVGGMMLKGKYSLLASQPDFQEILPLFTGMEHGEPER